MLRLAVAFLFTVASTPRMGLTTDLDGDGDADLRDFAIFQLAFTGPGLLPTASPADLNLDGRVDLADYRILFEGPEDPEPAPRTDPEEETQPLGRILLWFLFLLLLHLCIEHDERHGTGMTA